jgi:hypothetical protein
MDAASFNKPGTIPRQFQTEVRDGCPLDCGLCPEHKQHACLGIIEVNTGCNLDCPVCFADSGTRPHQGGGYAIDRAQCERMLDAYVAAEGAPEVIMFSGGEPSIHPRIIEFIDAARARPIREVVLNTNGLRLATDRRFAAALAERGVAVYLQFDGLDLETHREIRGRDLREAKRRALDNCADAGVTVLLAAAIERGVNEHEAGPVVEHGIKHPAVRGVVFQPVTHAGRHRPFDPLTRLTNSDVIAALCEQRPGWFRPADFFPVPCCFPACRSITYAVTDGTDVVPLPRLIDMADYLDYAANRALPDPQIRAALEKLWSASAVPGTAANEASLECAACGIALPEALAGLAGQAFMIVIQDFQDPYTLNVRQLMKCCVEEITPDGRIIPFCAYNSVGYREQVRAQMTGAPVPPVVPNALPLADTLAPSPNGSKMMPNGAAAAPDDAAVPRRRDATNTGRRLR